MSLRATHVFFKTIAKRIQMAILSCASLYTPFAMYTDLGPSCNSRLISSIDKLVSHRLSLSWSILPFHGDIRPARHIIICDHSNSIRVGSCGKHFVWKGSLARRAPSILDLGRSTQGNSKKQKNNPPKFEGLQNLGSPGGMDNIGPSERRIRLKAKARLYHVRGSYLVFRRNKNNNDICVFDI